MQLGDINIMLSISELKPIILSAIENGSTLGKEESFKATKIIPILYENKNVEEYDLLTNFIEVCDETIFLEDVFANQKLCEMITSILTVPEVSSEVIQNTIHIILSILTGFFSKEGNQDTLYLKSSKENNIAKKIFFNINQYDLSKIALILMEEKMNQNVIDDKLSLFVCDTVKAISLFIDVLDSFLTINQDEAIGYLYSDSMIFTLKLDSSFPLHFYSNKPILDCINNKYIPAVSKLYNTINHFKYEKPTAMISDLIVRKIREIYGEETFGSKSEAHLLYHEKSDFTLLDYLNIIIFLHSNNNSFQKSVGEQLLFENQNLFPFCAVLLSASKLTISFIKKIGEDDITNPFLQSIVYCRNLIMFELMTKILKLWIISHADGNNKQDFDSILQLADVIMNELKKKINIENLGVASDLTETSNYCVNFINNITYDEARNLQVNEVYKLQVSKWSNEMVEFRDMLLNQVFDYVKHQKIIQLQKGFWFYTENPLEENTSNPKVAYLIVSDNQREILVREFDTKTIDKPYNVNNEIICDSIDQPNKKVVKKPVTKTTIISFSEIKAFRPHSFNNSHSRKPRSSFSSSEQTDGGTNSLLSVTSTLSNEYIVVTDSDDITNNSKSNDSDNIFLEMYKKDDAVAIDAISMKNRPLLTFYFINKEDIVLDGLKILFYTQYYNRIPNHRPTLKPNSDQAYKTLYDHENNDLFATENSSKNLSNYIIEDLTPTTQEKIRTLIHIRFNTQMINLNLTNTENSSIENNINNTKPAQEFKEEASDEEDIYDLETLKALTINTYYT